MKLNEYIDVHELGQLVDEGFVSARRHPSLDLTVLNYTPKAVSIRPWGQTLCRCRGLVHSDDLDIVCHGFEKFWNYGDSSNGAGKESLPLQIPRVFEKVDGSYLAVSLYKGELVVNTRGSFESDQAKWALKWIKEHIVGVAWDKPFLDVLENRLSFIFEVLIPEDRKVVDYEYSGLVLLGAFRDDGSELSPDFANPYASKWLTGYKVVKEYDYDDLERLQSRNVLNEEGYVVTYYQPEGPAFRVKLKFSDYVRLHKIIFNTSSISIWDLTKRGEDVNIVLDGATEEVKSWANRLAEDIKEDHDSMKTSYTGAFRTIINLCNTQEKVFNPGSLLDKERRKTFAFYAKPYAHPELLFSLYDGRMDRFEDQVWELVKPVKSFFRKTESEEDQ